MDMNTTLQKALISLAVICAFSLTQVASAQTYMYSEASAIGDTSATVNVTNLMNSVQSNTEVTVTSNTGNVVAPPSGAVYVDDTYLTPQELQQYLRTLMSDKCFGAKQPCSVAEEEAIQERLDRLRKARKEMLSVPNGPRGKQEIRFEQHVQNVNGTTSGQVRVFRKENGQVVEDRVIQLPKGIPGKPIYLRASSSLATGTPHGFFIRSINASGSNAIFLRATSSPIPWLGQFGTIGEFTTIDPTSGSISFDSEGNAMLSPERKKQPIQLFMNRVFNLFKKAAGDDIQQ